jgi:hypothetical protein
MWIGLLNPDYFALLISFFRVTGCPLAHTSVLLVIGQEIASMWPLVAFTAMRMLVRLAEKWSL